MGLLSTSVSITRYVVEGELKKPIVETVAAALKKNAISEIDDQAAESTAGWTSFNTPYQPDFEGASFVFGTNLIFSLRIDRKHIPSKTIQKYVHMELSRKMSATGRPHLSKAEKKMIKDHVISVLNLRVPSTPNVYDVLWRYEEGILWFFSNLKAANEALESLFSTSFKLSLIRLFPYTTGCLKADLSASQIDVMGKLTPTGFGG